MGSEARCLVTWKGRQAEARALLETAELVVRGGLRLRIPLRDITALAVREGVLSVTTREGTADFRLGGQAERWAERIRHPRSRLDKLGVKPGMIVSVLGIGDDDFVSELRGREADVRVGRPAPGSDLIFLGLSSARDLSRMTTLRDVLKPNGAIWTVRGRGDAKVSEARVIETGRAAGLVDVKVARFSETHTAAKFVIPTAQRPR